MTHYQRYLSPQFGLHPGELRSVTVGSEGAMRCAEERSPIVVALGAAAFDIQHIGSIRFPPHPVSERLTKTMYMWQEARWRSSALEPRVRLSPFFTRRSNSRMGRP